MRMDDSVSIGKLDGASQSQTDFDASTRILCELTSDGLEFGAPWQTDTSICGEGRCDGPSLASSAP